MSKYYVVIKGRQPGIYNSWVDCQKQVQYFKNNCYKAFACYEEASLFYKKRNQFSSKVDDDSFEMSLNKPNQSESQNYENNFSYFCDPNASFSNALNNSSPLLNSDECRINNKSIEFASNPKNPSFIKTQKSESSARNFDQCKVDDSAINQNKVIVAYTDGSCYNNGKKGARGGYGVYFENNVLNCIQQSIPSHYNQTNNVAELLAIIECLKIVPKNRKLIIYTDSNYCLLGLNNYYPKWKQNGFLTTSKKPVANQNFWLELDSLLALRQNTTHFLKVKAHSGVLGNEKADLLAKLSVLAN